VFVVGCIVPDALNAQSGNGRWWEDQTLTCCVAGVSVSNLSFLWEFQMTLRSDVATIIATL
jgi:hypothetical protein